MESKFFAPEKKNITKLKVVRGHYFCYLKKLKQYFNGETFFSLIFMIKLKMNYLREQIIGGTKQRFLL